MNEIENGNKTVRARHRCHHYYGRLWILLTKTDAASSRIFFPGCFCSSILLALGGFQRGIHLISQLCPEFRSWSPGTCFLVFSTVGNQSIFDRNAWQRVLSEH